MNREQLNALRRGITPTMRGQIMDAYSGQCYYCRSVAFEIDHVIAVARGGGLDLENLVPACWECNHEKSDQTVEEWAAARVAAGKLWPIPSIERRIQDAVEAGYCFAGCEPYGWTGTVLGFDELRALLMHLRDHKSPSASPRASVAARSDALAPV